MNRFDTVQTFSDNCYQPAVKRGLTMILRVAALTDPFALTVNPLLLILPVG